MEKKYIEDQTFDNEDFTKTIFKTGEYENCIFRNCNFSNTDLSSCSFIDCSFVGCNLSMPKTNKTAFQEVKFTGCKMLGMQFGDCSDFLFSIDCEKCNMNFCVFGKQKLRQSKIRNSTLLDADFTGTDCSGFVFDDCDLERAKFENTDLASADLRTSFHYSLDPEQNKIRQAKFSLAGLPGLLDKYDIEIE